MKIPETTWDRIVSQALALLTAVLVFGNTVLGWNLGDDKMTAIAAMASALLTLLTVILYANNSQPNAAVDAYIAGAWSLGKREAAGQTAADGGPFRVGAIKGVAPTRAQVKRFVEGQPDA